MSCWRSPAATRSELGEKMAELCASLFRNSHYNQKTEREEHGKQKTLTAPVLFDHIETDILALSLSCCRYRQPYVHHTSDCSCSSADWVCCRRVATSAAPSLLCLNDDSLLFCKVLWSEDKQWEVRNHQTSMKQSHIRKTPNQIQGTYLMCEGQGLSAGVSICERWGRFSVAYTSFNSISASFLDPADFLHPGTKLNSCSRNRSCLPRLSVPWINGLTN